MFSTTIHPLKWYRDKQVTVVGLGAFGGGAGVTQFLHSLEARLTVTDLKTAEELEEQVAALDGLDIRWVLGEHREEDLLGADLIVLNPAVQRDIPLVRMCLDAGVPLETEMNLFFKYCRGKICAVTGSNGKTTTASLVAAMARQRWPQLLLGGNIGRSLLPEVENILEDDWVVLELSSFQLADLSCLERRPEISLITNLSENHLDWHKTYENYLAAKREILAPALPAGLAVLNLFDSTLADWAKETPRKIAAIAAGIEGELGIAVDHEDGSVRGLTDGEEKLLFCREDLQIRGDFNLLNAATAAAAAIGMGINPAEILAAVRSFTGVEHRLQSLGTHEGVEYFNDSIATTQESTIAALESLGPDVILICGGSSKGCGFSDLAEVAAGKARHVVLIGETASEIEAALLELKEDCPATTHAPDLEAAVEEATRLARPGDRVLLSPACPSYDQFRNFEERGRTFCELISRRFN
ncbi:MAG: UDP-N-acetylmuramoyl-L-alanine--D-glutamate ligase [Planctomycetota bacterium]